jgi:hypothetical protein
VRTSPPNERLAEDIPIDGATKVREPGNILQMRDLVVSTQGPPQGSRRKQWTAQSKRVLA